MWVFYGNIQNNTADTSKTKLSKVTGSDSCVVYRSASGDREYWENAPTLRSLSNTGGKHQSGSGAVKVRKYESDGSYTQRPMTPKEAEALMGWEEESTAWGIDANGRKIPISDTQRKKILGNGIVPQEISVILRSIGRCHDSL